MKAMNKILIILIIIFLLINIFNTVFALEHPENYLPDDPTVRDAEKLTDKVGIILGAVRNISAVISVIVIMIIGIRYMIGSVEERANYKSSMAPYVIGCIMATAGTALVSAIYEAVH